MTKIRTKKSYATVLKAAETRFWGFKDLKTLTCPSSRASNFCVGKKPKTIPETT
jgi:hypothetical protein